MQRRKQAAVDEIVSAALDLFSRDGLAETTVDALAEAAGCSRRTFYRYFGSKEDVLFYDLPAAFDRLAERLEGHLANGLGPWEAVSEAVAGMIARFPYDEQPVHRMELWLREPALRARYMQYIADAERAILDTVTAYRGTRPESDDLAQLMAIAAVGAYRTSVITHPAGGNRKLTRHLRELLGVFDTGFGANGYPALAASAAKENGRARTVTS
jgi:AcrR family transcriptional regulator